MDAILDAIFGNFLVVLAIIGGIVGFLKDRSNKESDKDNGKPYQVPRPTQTPSGGNYQSQRQTPTIHSNTDMTALEEVQEKQMQQLADRMNTNRTQSEDIHLHDAIIGNTIGEKSHQKAKEKKQVNHNLTGKGLVDGIIMAEVLGPPRAVKPYKSIVANRKK